MADDKRGTAKDLELSGLKPLPPQRLKGDAGRLRRNAGPETGRTIPRRAHRGMFTAPFFGIWIQQAEALCDRENSLRSLREIVKKAKGPLTRSLRPDS